MAGQIFFGTVTLSSGQMERRSKICRMRKLQLLQPHRREKCFAKPIYYDNGNNNNNNNSNNNNRNKSNSNSNNNIVVIVEIRIEILQGASLRMSSLRHIKVTGSDIEGRDYNNYTEIQL